MQYNRPPVHGDANKYKRAAENTRAKMRYGATPRGAGDPSRRLPTKLSVGKDCANAYIARERFKWTVPHVEFELVRTVLSNLRFTVGQH
ncbi:hypothetical protein EVAR_23209_1 [Eumeta japonica]|uniref:Uncharacterized protein n=1 Tax=Eumeta variegata TaxID=151549 RepID=A0A4C1VF67_EUMVA|nr:hypothetical protein EVAR_23209_1 [Eumeta japonica]